MPANKFGARWAFVLVVVLLGCKAPAKPPQAPAPEATKAAAPPFNMPAPKVPKEGDAFSPALSALASGETANPAALRDFATCTRCHRSIVEEWKESAHSFASLTNPLYLRSFSDFQKARGEDKARFCAGCHDPALLFDPTARLTTDPGQAGAHVGVSCGVCHGAVAARPAGNGAYTLTTTAIPLPHPGDADSLDQHLARVGNATLRTNTLCISCHRGALTPAMGHEVALLGLDEWGPWRRSPYADNSTTRLDEEHVGPQGCTDCHMPKVAGHRSHRFAGGHTTLAAMTGSSAQLAATQSMLQGAATLDVFEVPANRAPKAARGALVFDVVIFNERVGHNFPGGAKDLRDTWLEVLVEDAEGKVIAASGVEHERSGREPYAYVLHTRVANQQGQVQAEHEVSHFRTAVFDHTIAPRDAAVARYALKLPGGMDKGGSFSVRARLRHRRLSMESARAACQQFKTPLGQAFKHRLRALKGLPLDGCVAQPVVDVSSTRLTFTRNTEPEAATGEAAWRREYRYGLGLLHSVQEDLDEARCAFERALAALGPTASARLRAMALQGLAEVAAQQSRRDDALALYQRVEGLMPNQPSTAFGEGTAHLNLWRFEEAAAAFRKATTLKEDDRSFRQLAAALGSSNRPQDALLAAQKGLSFEGRDALLLRSQLLAYRALGAAETVQGAAETAVNTYERDVEAPHVRDRCSRNDPVCRLDRTPLGLRWLRPPR